MKRIVITGAAGNIGGKIMHGLKGRYELVPVDRRGGDGILRADLSKQDMHWERHFSGAQAVIHLAGNPNEKAPWRDLLRDNIHALLNVWHCAAGAGVERLVFASSCHTMGGYWRGEDTPSITSSMPPMPDSDYGASKLVGEEICRNLSSRHRISGICLRIGWVPRDGRMPGPGTGLWQRSVWLGSEDLLRIVTCAVEAVDIGFGIFFAVSRNKPGIWDISEAERTLGYRPVQGV